jgi:hypothetical protein
MAKKLTAAQQALLDDLGGGAEIAARCGVTRAVVSMWQGRYDDFPQPILTLKAGRFYRLSEVQAWGMKRGFCL